MVRRNPVGKLAESTLNALKDPKGAADKVVNQAKGTAALGRAVAGTAGGFVGKAARRVRGRRDPEQAPGAGSPRAAAGVEGAQGTANLRAVPDVREPAQTRPASSPRKQGDALADTSKTDQTGESPSGAGTRKDVGRAPAKPAAKKAPATKAAPVKTASPADVADVVESAVAEDPSKTAATPAKEAPASNKATKSAADSPGDKLPAKKAPAKKAPAKKAPAKKAPAKKATAKKATPKKATPNEATSKKAPAKKAPAKKTPANAQPESGAEPVVDPSSTKQVASEAATLRNAAENNPE